MKELHLWMKSGQKKVTLQVKNEMLDLVLKCKKKKINIVILSAKGEDITDQDDFQIEDKSSILIIGPDYEKKINPITNHLKLF